MMPSERKGRHDGCGFDRQRMARHQMLNTKGGKGRKRVEVAGKLFHGPTRNGGVFHWSATLRDQAVKAVSGDDGALADLANLKLLLLD